MIQICLSLVLEFLNANFAGQFYFYNILFVESK